ncbi:unnamed protein product, partial [Staurois parvus]
MRSGYPAVKPQAVTAECPHGRCRHLDHRTAGKTGCGGHTA